MMEFKSKYVSKKPDARGFVEYTPAEHETWRTLYTRQMEIIPGRACDEFITGLSKLHLSADCIPQLPEINEQLHRHTGWGVEPVTALISAEKFFELLAARKFPAATFIRVPEELNYIKEPDVFHELFGHCPMLTDKVYADFIQGYAEFVLSCPQEDWALLQRLFWFTVEFGLILTPQGLRAYGGGILSSIGETVYCVESVEPQRQLFNPVAIFRTPYRIDMMQPVYFVITDYQQLYDVVSADLASFMREARELGEFPPLFQVDPHNPNIHISAC